MKTEYIKNMHKVYTSIHNNRRYKKQSNTLYNFINKDYEVIHK